jgi:hypothetical protein
METARIMKAVRWARDADAGMAGYTQRGPRKCGPGQTRRLIFNHFPQYWICGEVRESLAIGP